MNDYDGLRAVDMVMIQSCQHKESFRLPEDAYWFAYLIIFIFYLLIFISINCTMKLLFSPL
jgi:hypothetical protein